MSSSSRNTSFSFYSDFSQVSLSPMGLSWPSQAPLFAVVFLAPRMHDLSQWSKSDCWMNEWYKRVVHPHVDPTLDLMASSQLCGVLPPLGSFCGPRTSIPSSQLIRLIVLKSPIYLTMFSNRYQLEDKTRLLIQYQAQCLAMVGTWMNKSLGASAFSSINVEDLLASQFRA